MRCLLCNSPYRSEPGLDESLFGGSKIFQVFAMSHQNAKWAQDRGFDRFARALKRPAR